MAGDNVIEVRDLTLDYGQHRVLRGVDLTVTRGESVSVMGRSGSGKSSLLHVLAGLLRPTSGQVRSGQDDLTRMRPGALRRWRLASCGLVFQFGELLPELTLAENALLPSRLIDPNATEAASRVRHLMVRLGIEDVADHLPSQSSGGQVQRAAIVRALAHRPRMVLADEPTGALDSASSRVVRDLLVDTCRDEGAALVLVSHDEEVAAAADHRYRMNDGVLSVASITAA